MSWQIRRTIGGKAFWTLLGSLLRTAYAKTNWSKSKKKRKWSYKKYGVVLLVCFFPPWKAARHANEAMDHITNTLFSFCAWVGLLNQRPVPQHSQAKLSPCSTWEHFLTHTHKKENDNFFLKAFFPFPREQLYSLFSKFNNVKLSEKDQRDINTFQSSYKIKESKQHNYRDNLCFFCYKSVCSTFCGLLSREL